MRLFITGATGVVGRRIVVDRLERGDRLVLLSRDRSRAVQLFAADSNPNIEIIQGNPAAPGVWQRCVDGCDAVIQLAGASIADRRWSTAYKKTLVNSRIDSTHQVVSAMAQAKSPPKLLINASAVGYYGDTRDRLIDEDAPPGDDFLSKLCVRWEQQTRHAEQLGARIVLLRLGVVLDERGGGLPTIAKPFRLFAGGPIGMGRQYMPWIHFRDVVGLIQWIIDNPEITGPVNAVAPQAVTNREFCRTLGAVMRRPSFFAVPKPMLRLLVGEFATYLTMSQRVAPARALRSGFVFMYPELRPALQSLIRQPVSGGATIDDQHDSPQPIAPLESPANLGAWRASGSSVEPPKPIRLIVVDVDGTLLDSDSRLNRSVTQACRAAERAGCAVILATARGPRMTDWIAQTLDITAPTINYNGALIWNPVNRQTQYHETIDEDVARRVVHAVREASPSIMVALEVLDRWYTDRVDPAFEQLTPPDSVGPLKMFLAAPMTRITLLGAPTVIGSAMAVVREQFWQAGEIALYQPDPTVVQIVHPLADKGIAAQRVAQRIGISADEVMAIGDATNDLGMLSWAGFAVAVANATPAVREIADVVVPSNDDVGVARAIHRYVLAQQLT